MLPARRLCSTCYQLREAVYNPIIGYGTEHKVTRVDRTYRYCDSCIERGHGKQRAIGVVIGWQEDKLEDD